MNNKYNKYNKNRIEPFFNSIINSIKQFLFTILRGVLSPIIDILKKMSRIVVDFIANKVLRPIFRPIGVVLSLFVAPLKPLFSFIGKILSFIVIIIKLILNFIDMILSLPFRILGGLGLITYPEKSRDSNYKDLNELQGVMKISNIVDDLNDSMVDSANKVNKVINKPNLILFVTIIVLSIIFISCYYFYDEFNSIVDKLLTFIKSLLYPKVNEL
jgi:hypothetical protein